MTIAQTDKEIRDLIRKHHVYGLECIISAIVRNVKSEPYITKDVIHALIESAYDYEFIVASEEIL